MKWPVVDKCCCCLSLRTGVLVFGGLNAASALIGLIGTVVILETIDEDVREAILTISGPQNKTTVQEYDISKINLQTYEVSIVFFGLRLMLSVILIVGAKKRDAVFLKIFIVYQLIQLALLFIWVLVEISVDGSFTRVIDLGFQIYFIIVIRSLMIEVQTIQLQEYDENNINAFKNTEVN